jgi:hypothetical protein
MVSGGVHMAGGTRFAVPLPAGPARLVDRAGELSVLDGLLTATARGPLLVVITGAPGMGKTAVALWWLHARDGEFPDGQLHADLGGSHGGEAVADVLARWLRALGVPPEWIPAAEAELAALWRSVTAGKKLAVLVENAASVAGVRILLPGAGPSVVAVTSRRRLPAAAGDGARFIHMGPLPADAAVGLLGQIAGAGRVAAEHAAALRLVAYCGGVPLAVCAAAGQLAIWAGERIADAAAGLDPQTPWTTKRTRRRECAPAWTRHTPHSTPARHGPTGCSGCTPALTSPPGWPPPRWTPAGPRPARCWPGWRPPAWQSRPGWAGTGSTT